MRRTFAAATLLAAALAGVVTGFAVAFSTAGSDAEVGSREPRQFVPVAIESAPIEPAGSPDTPTPVPLQEPMLVLAWTSGGLPAGYGQAIAALAGIERSTVVRGDELGLVATFDAGGKEVERWIDGWRLPLDVLAVDPGVYADLVGLDPAIPAALGVPGAGVLTQTSARLRGIGVGGSLELIDGRRVRIVAVVDDREGSGAELLVSHETGQALSVTTERFVLARSVLDRAALDRGLVGAAGGTHRVRVRVEGESPYLRHGDAVLPLALVKAEFGEFAFRPLPGRDVEIDAAWVEDHIVTVELPVVGTTRCHVEAAPRLHDLLSDLEARNLAHLVDPNGYAGCFVPRRIGPGLALSRHSWGIAVDVNVMDNPSGSVSTKDIRLVDAFADTGFSWGGDWLVPDPMHFEITALS